MMVSILAAMLIPAPSAGESLMDLARAHYRSLDSFAMTIEHQDSSGLFPGRYTQSLQWRKGGRFELIVTKPSDYQPQADAPGGLAPNYYCDGKTVVSIHRTGERTSRSLSREPNSTPGWEVAGGLILSWLMNGVTAERIANPPKGVTIEYRAGSARSWQGHAVREVIVEMSQSGKQLDLHAYFGPERPELLGLEWMHQGKPGAVHYLHQQANPTLPPTLGDPPAAR